MTCKDCIHIDVCVAYTPTDLYHTCSSFKNKTDFVEVVRCRDCKFYTIGDYRCDHPEMYGEDCYDFWLETNEDDFCSYGERKGT